MTRLNRLFDEIAWWLDIRRARRLLDSSNGPRTHRTK